MPRHAQHGQAFFKAAQLAATLYRFNTLRLATRVFSNAPDQVLSRRFYGRTLHLNVSRGNPQRLLYLEGERFIDERDIVRRLIRPGLAAVDVGANIGYYALMLAHYSLLPGGEHPPSEIAQQREPMRGQVSRRELNYHAFATLVPRRGPRIPAKS
jgi:hypothetical protein